MRSATFCVLVGAILGTKVRAFVPRTSIRGWVSRMREKPSTFGSVETLCLRQMKGDSCDPQENFLGNAMGKSLAGVVLSLTMATMPSMALDSTVFNHEYSDPLHPSCRRKIEVSKDGTTFHYSGTAVGAKDDPILRGCTPKEISEFGIRKGEFDGKILADGRISAGDGIHEGVWEPANTATTSLGYEDSDGIRWNDGNKWTVKEKSLSTVIGEGIFLAYIGFSTLAGVKGVYDGIQRKRQEGKI